MKDMWRSMILRSFDEGVKAENAVQVNSHQSINTVDLADEDDR